MLRFGCGLFEGLFGGAGEGGGILLEERESWGLFFVRGSGFSWNESYFGWGGAFVVFFTLFLLRFLVAFGRFGPLPLLSSPFFSYPASAKTPLFPTLFPTNHPPQHRTTSFDPRTKKKKQKTKPPSENFHPGTPCLRPSLMWFQRKHLFFVAFFGMFARGRWGG